MRVLVLGGDGYLGWPTAMRFAAKGHDVMAVDNYLRRTIAKATSSEPLVDSPDLIERARIFESASNYKVRVEIGDCCDYPFLKGIFEKF